MRVLPCFVAIVVLTLPASARIAVPRPPAVAHHVALADAVLVGRIVALEDKDVEAAPDPGVGMERYRVAVLSVTERISGAKDAKTVRIFFLPKVEPRLPWRNPQPKLGDDGVFFLTRHFKEDFYLLPVIHDFEPRAGPDFDKQLREARETAKLLDERLDALRSKNVNTRLKVASLLVARYCATDRTTLKKEAIDAAESKLILKAILDGDLFAPPKPDRPNSWTTFLALGLTPADGWKLPVDDKTVKDFRDVARVWLEKNWESHRLKRNVFVTDK